MLFFNHAAGGKKRDFWLTLVRNLLAHAVQKQWIQRPIGRPQSTATNVGRLRWWQKALACSINTTAMAQVFSYRCNAQSNCEVSQI